MKKEVYYKILLIIIVTLLFFTINSICFANNEDENLVTNDFEISTYSSNNGESQYGSYINKDNENILLLVKATDYNLPSNLYDYKDDIRLKITYSQDDYKVLNCKVINYKTDEIIEDISEENINKLFNIEYGKNITQMNWNDKIKLSELKENEIYKYTANTTIQFPEFENDTEKNCIIYIKQKDNKNYEKEINMYKEISSPSISVSFNEYDPGDTFSVMYRTVANEELLELIPKDEIIYLSNYNNGDELEYSFEKYIYNNTEKNITIHTKSTNLTVEISDSVTIEKGQIYGFDWMIESASVNYLEDINNEENDNKEEQDGNKTEENNENEEQKDEIQIDKEDNNKDENKQTEQTKEDNTQASGTLPQTGKSVTIFISIVFAIIMAIISYRKCYKFKYEK